ncbi:hypothetical protein GF356_08300 [candidate division GN15 bacterium]|nr:hypothetical protein [candidate division GN15 bacterium]
MEHVLSFVGSDLYDSVIVDTLSPHELGKSPWADFLPVNTTQYAKPVRVVFTNAKITRETYGPRLTVQVITDEISGAPLVGITSKDVGDIGNLPAVTFDDIRFHLSANTPVRLLDFGSYECTSSMRDVIDPPFVMPYLQSTKMTIYQLVPATIAGDTTCVWVLTLCEPSVFPAWEADYGIEIVDVRTDSRLISWANFPDTSGLTIDMRNWWDIFDSSR